MADLRSPARPPGRLRYRAVVVLGTLHAGCDSSGHTEARAAAPTSADTIAITSIPSATLAPPGTASATVQRAATGCPAGEVHIPPTGGDGFTLGAGLHGDRDTPHRVVITKPFCFDATEVTVKAYKECVDAGKCEPPRTWGLWINYPTKLDHPVNKLGWRSARAYCKSRGQDLPTEAQWEWAATGGDGRKWAWGNEEPSCEHADFTPGVLARPASDDGCRGGGTSPVGSMPKGDRLVAGARIHDLSGNVWEWILDNYAPYKPTTVTDPLHAKNENDAHVVRGGGWNRSARGILVHYRGAAPRDYQVPGLGFRCARAL